MVLNSNSNWIEWRTIKCVVARVILKFRAYRFGNYEHEYTLNCTMRSPTTNQLYLVKISKGKVQLQVSNKQKL